jgi:hypothetical protein
MEACYHFVTGEVTMNFTHPPCNMVLHLCFFNGDSSRAIGNFSLIKNMRWLLTISQRDVRICCLQIQPVECLLASEMFTLSQVCLTLGTRFIGFELFLSCNMMQIGGMSAVEYFPERALLPAALDC